MDNKEKNPSILLAKLIKMAEKVEYMHNFQHERFDIVEYIHRTHEIMKLLKETKEESQC